MRLVAWARERAHELTFARLAPQLTDPIRAVLGIIAWNTVYPARVLDQLRAAGELITTSAIEHISPLVHQHIHLYGHYPFDVASRPDGHRPLRAPAATPTPAPKTLNRV